MQKQKQNQNNFPAHLVSFCWVRSSKLTQMGLVGHQTCVYQPVYPSRSIARVRDNSQSVDGQAAHRRAAADGACFSPLQKEMTRLGQKGGSTIIFTFSGSGGPIFTFRSVETTVTNLRACAAVVAALPGFRKGGGANAHVTQALCASPPPGALGAGAGAASSRACCSLILSACCPSPDPTPQRPGPAGQRLQPGTRDSGLRDPVLRLSAREQPQTAQRCAWR